MEVMKITITQPNNRNPNFTWSHKPPEDWVVLTCDNNMRVLRSAKLITTCTKPVIVQGHGFIHHFQLLKPVPPSLYI